MPRRGEQVVSDAVDNCMYPSKAADEVRAVCLQNGLRISRRARRALHMCLGAFNKCHLDDLQGEISGQRPLICSGQSSNSIPLK